MLFLVFLLVGVVAFFYWRHRTTTLTRDCRWRQDRVRGDWRCAFCGARHPGTVVPKACLRDA